MFMCLEEGEYQYGSYMICWRYY